MLAALLCGCSGGDAVIEDTLIADNDLQAVTESDTAVEQPGSFIDSNLQAVIGINDDTVYTLNADDLKADHPPFADAKQLLSDDKLISRIKEAYKNETTFENSYLYQQSGCYISEFGIGMFSVKGKNTSDTLTCLAFTEELEEIGEIIFFDVDGKPDYNLTFRSKNVSANSDILTAALRDTSKRYIALTTIRGYAFLDSDNKLSGLGKKYIEISGDCWSVLEQSGLSFSYSDIIYSDNLKWIDLE